MDVTTVPLLQTTRVVMRYCLPEGSNDLPHVTHQLDALLDTFSAAWTIVRAYKRTKSLRCVQYVASRELLETQDPFYKRWLLNRTAELAARRGDLLTLQWLMETYVLVEPVDYVVEVAAAFGHLGMLQWLYAHHFERVQFGRFEMCGALEHKHEDVVNWLREHAVPAAESRSKVLRSAAKGGNLEVIEWLCDEFELDATHLRSTVVVGRLHAGLLSDSTCPGSTWTCISRNMKPQTGMIHVAAAHGYLDMVKWLYSDQKVIVEAMEDAALNGHLDVVQWLSDTSGSRYALSRAFVRAAESGRLEMLQWLHMRSPVTGGNIAMDFAARGGHLDVVKWLHENRTEGCSVKAMNKAAVNGHFDVVKWLHEHRSEGCSTIAMDGAAGAGHLEVVKWLNDHRSEGCSTEAMNCGAQNGHLDVVQWLHANRKEGCTSVAMDLAARNGHLDIVKWLHENRSEGCTSAAMDQAATYGHLKVVKWLYDQMRTLYNGQGCCAWTLERRQVAPHEPLQRLLQCCHDPRDCLHTFRRSALPALPPQERVLSCQQGCASATRAGAVVSRELPRQSQQLEIRSVQVGFGLSSSCRSTTTTTLPRFMGRLSSSSLSSSIDFCSAKCKVDTQVGWLESRTNYLGSFSLLDCRHLQEEVVHSSFSTLITTLSQRFMERMERLGHEIISGTSF